MNIRYSWCCRVDKNFQLWLHQSTIRRHRYLNINSTTLWTKINNLPEVLQVQAVNDDNGPHLIGITIHGELLLINKDHPKGKIITLDQSIEFIKYIDVRLYSKYEIVILIDSHHNVYQYSIANPSLSRLLATNIKSISGYPNDLIWVGHDGVISVYDGQQLCVLETSCKVILLMNGYLVSDDYTIYKWKISNYLDNGIIIRSLLMTEVFKVDYIVRQVATYPNPMFITVIDDDGDNYSYRDENGDQVDYSHRNENNDRVDYNYQPYNLSNNIKRFITTNSHLDAELRNGRMSSELLSEDSLFRLINLEEYYGSRIKVVMG